MPDEALLAGEYHIAQLRLHRFVAQKGLRQSQNFSMEQLETIYHKLLETDLSIKTGQMDQVLALDMLIAGLSKSKTKG